jgi:two-component system chemotaxis response regulator CheB
MIRVLVVDDTALYRNILAETLKTLPEVRIVGTAPNGKIALSRIFSLKPDLVTLDIEMPEMNGIEVLEALRAKGLDTVVVVVSSLTQRGGELTMRALELGAFDFVTKPGGEGGKSEDFARPLAAIVGVLAKRLEIKSILKDVVKPRAAVENGFLHIESANESFAVDPDAVHKSVSGGKREIVAIAASTGGPQALLSMMPRLPSGITAPILVVQHMPPLFTASLAKSLASRCAFPVKEAENGEPLVGGTAYIAPGGRQMKIGLASDATTKVLRVTDDPPENHCRPSADYLFRSVAHLYYGRATGVIMTGMGSDGALGLKALKRAGATIIAQDEGSCVVYGMPKAAVDENVVDAVLPLGKIADAIAASLH